MGAYIPTSLGKGVYIVYIGVASAGQAAPVFSAAVRPATQGLYTPSAGQRGIYTYRSWLTKIS